MLNYWYFYVWYFSNFTSNYVNCQWWYLCEKGFVLQKQCVMGLLCFQGVNNKYHQFFFFLNLSNLLVHRWKKKSLYYLFSQHAACCRDWTDLYFNNTLRSVLAWKNKNCMFFLFFLFSFLWWTSLLLWTFVCPAWRQFQQEAREKESVVTTKL